MCRAIVHWPPTGSTAAAGPIRPPRTLRLGPTRTFDARFRRAAAALSKRCVSSRSGVALGDIRLLLDDHWSVTVAPEAELFATGECVGVQQHDLVQFVARPEPVAEDDVEHRGAIVSLPETVGCQGAEVDIGGCSTARSASESLVASACANRGPNAAAVEVVFDMRIV
jgi:hypothetical protein